LLLAHGRRIQLGDRRREPEARRGAGSLEGGAGAHGGRRPVQPRGGAPGRRTARATGGRARGGSSPARPTSSSTVPGDAATAAASPLSRKIPTPRRGTNLSQSPAPRMKVARN